MKESKFLSRLEKSFRSVYLSLRTGLEQHLYPEILVRSYEGYKELGKPYPFNKRVELFPGKRNPRKEYKDFRDAFVIFCEGKIPKENWEDFRIRRGTKYVPENLRKTVAEVLISDFEQGDTNLTSHKFPNLLRNSLGLESALVIQRDTSLTSRARFNVTDLSVKVDGKVTKSAESLAKHLKYISPTGSIYDHDDLDNMDSSRVPVFEKLEELFYEYYGINEINPGNKKIATAEAAQFLRVLDHMATVYSASKEDRFVTRICGSELSKTLLVRVPKKDIGHLEEKNGINMDDYTWDENTKGRVVMFQIGYNLTPASTPPQDKGVRTFDHSLRYRWRKIDKDHELILPRMECSKLRPLFYPAVSKPRNGLL